MPRPRTEQAIFLRADDIRPVRAVLWNTAGRAAMTAGVALHHAGLALCGLAGHLDARADTAGYWTAHRRARLHEELACGDL